MWRFAVVLVAALWVVATAAGLSSQDGSPSVEPTMVPTPGTAVLGVAGLWLLRRGRKRGS